LQQEILDKGYVSVNAEETMLAKGWESQQQLKITFKTEISSIGVIDLTFYKENGDSKTIEINAWKTEGNHLSGTKTKEQFEIEIRTKLGFEIN